MGRKIPLRNLTNYVFLIQIRRNFSEHGEACMEKLASSEPYISVGKIWWAWKRRAHIEKY